MLSLRHPPSLAVLCAVLVAHGLLIGTLLRGVTSPAPVAPLVNAPPPQNVQAVRLLAAPLNTKPAPLMKTTPSPLTTAAPSLGARPALASPPKASEHSSRPAVPAEVTATAPVPSATQLAPTPETFAATPSATAPPAGAKSAVRGDEIADANPKARSAPTRSGVAPADTGVTLPDAQPYYQYNPKPVYPERSHRLREEGKVVLRVWVGVDGLPTKAEVANSSGYERLNAVALRTVMGWRFTPGKRNGQAQAMEVLVPMSFRLEGP